MIAKDIAVGTRVKVKRNGIHYPAKTGIVVSNISRFNEQVLCVEWDNDWFEAMNANVDDLDVLTEDKPATKEENPVKEAKDIVVGSKVSYADNDQYQGEVIKRAIKGGKEIAYVEWNGTGGASIYMLDQLKLISEEKTVSNSKTQTDIDIGTKVRIASLYNQYKTGTVIFNRCLAGKHLVCIEFDGNGSVELVDVNTLEVKYGGESWVSFAELGKVKR